MELKRLCEETLKIFEIESVSELSNKLLQTVLSNDTAKFQQFVDVVEDLSIDWLQKIFQYYEADRTEKKQDYTPKSISKLCSHLTEIGGKTVYDICTGSGALTIQKWCLNPNKTFICEELDSNVIPFLLFNMAIRNMNGYVINSNVLAMGFTGLFKVYRVTSGDKFSTVEETKDIPIVQADEIISNPPYNIKWDVPTPLMDDDRFQSVPIPPASNANFAFVFTAISRLKEGGKCAFVLPNGVLSSDIEKECRQYLIDNGYIEKVMLLPDKMFESTTISTCILSISKGNSKVQFYDCRKKGEQEQREQNGQFGGKSHTNRTYYKTINVLPDELINTLCGECEDIAEFSAVVSLGDVKANDYILTPSRYIRFDEQQEKHRDLQEIADNINFISQMQNSCKLVVNETIAKQLGLDIETYKQSKANSIDMKNQMKSIGIELETEDFISFTKNKNEFVFKCNCKENLPTIFLQFFSVWKNQIALLNEMQNQYLAELRDALLPDLMSGKIEL